MDTNELFNHYRKTASTPIPRDAKFLEGMFVIRRVPGSVHAVCGEIVKASAGRQQFQVRVMVEEHRLEWCAFASLIDDVILFHSSGDMMAAFTMLARNWQEETRAEKQAKQEAV